MKISIIIPTFNEGRNICKAIRHIRAASTSANIQEILVVDCCSDDQTVKSAECENARTLLSRRKGRAAQMNIGAYEAKGDVLYFLHADSFPPKGFDQAILRRVSKGYESGCFRMKFDSSHHLLRFSSWCTRLKPIVFRGGDQSLFVTNATFEKLGGFDESLSLMEDYDMVRRLRSKVNFSIVPQYLVTSARRYRNNGVYRLQFIYSVIHLLYFLGFSQDVLQSFYAKYVNPHG